MATESVPFITKLAEENSDPKQEACLSTEAELQLTEENVFNPHSMQENSMSARHGLENYMSMLFLTRSAAFKVLC
eukprot:4706947-Karenia_brevis.AAC.1